jgi:radical SAM protein with 4Fe4S-binding SPASM domain
MRWQTNKGSIELTSINQSASASMSLSESISTAQKLLGDGNTSAAIELCASKLQNNTNNTDLLHILGVAKFQEGNHQESIKFLQQSIVLSPDNNNAISNLLDIYKNLNKIDEAVQFFSELYSKNQDLDFLWSILVDLTVGHQSNIDNSLTKSLVLSTPPFFNRLQIEINTFCNLKCAECPRTVGINNGTWKNKNMSFAMFSEIVGYMPRSRMLVLQGVGEPTLHPELKKMIEHAKGLNKFQLIGFNTNALAKSINYYTELKNAGLTNVSISVDSFNQEIAEVCRSGTLVDRLKERIMKLSAIFNNLVISIVASKNNLMDISNTLSQLNKIGSFYVEIQPAINYKSTDDDATLSDKDLSYLKTMIADKKNNWKNINVGLSAHASSFDTDIRCTRPYMAPFITVDGYLTPCCTTYDRNHYGSTKFNNNIDTVWQSENVQNWLNNYMIKEPEICEGCCFNPNCNI